MKATRTKLARAELDPWRRDQEAWRRARGLRRELLLRDKERNVVELERRSKEIKGIRERMLAAERQDSAALIIQVATRNPIRQPM